MYHMIDFKKKKKQVEKRILLEIVGCFLMGTIMGVTFAVYLTA